MPIPTTGNNSLDGTPDNDSIDGLAGDDEIFGFAGNDTLRGNTGGDLLDGGAGEDWLLGGGGLDVLLGGDDNDTLVSAGAASDLMYGGLGDDLYYAAWDHQIADDGGRDTVVSGDGFAVIEGVEIEVIRLVGSADVFFFGSSSDERVIGNAGNDTLDGQGGDDTLIGGAGSNLIAGGDGDDSLVGGAGGGQIGGSAGNDQLDAGAGYTWMSGDGGDDHLRGSSGISSLLGGDGNDTLRSGAGPDTLSSGLGDDLYFLGPLSSIEIESDHGGRDTVIGSGDVLGGEGIEVIRLVGTGDTTVWSGWTNILIVGNAGNNTLVDWDNDRFDRTAIDTLRGGDGNDRLVVHGGADILRGGAGADAFVLMAPGAANYVRDFTPGEDHIEVSLAGFIGLTAAEGTDVGTTSQFALAGAVRGTGPTFVYNPTNGWLSWDANGSAPGERMPIARLAGTPTLTAADIQSSPDLGLAASPALEDAHPRAPPFTHRIPLSR
jgi:Ca2+-binding RTX toxin-like protein